MKKTVFALQVFGLIAMLPLVAFLELQHVTHNDNAPAAVASKARNAHTGLTESVLIGPSWDAWAFCLETYFSNKGW